MSKRAHEEVVEKPRAESREERWMRKMKFYEDKLVAKRRRRAESDINQDLPVGVQTEDHPEYIEHRIRTESTPSPENQEPVGAEYSAFFDSNYTSPPSTSVDNVFMPAPPARPAPSENNGVTFHDISEMSETTAPSSPGSIIDNVYIGEFDPILLKELGGTEADPVEFGDELQVDVAAGFQKILVEGLKKELKEELLKKYPIPKNVPFAKGPTLNPEIGAMLQETCKLRDKRLLAKQDQLGKSLSAVGKALSGLLKRTPDIPDVIRTLNDAGKLLADSHFAETDTRRSVIIPLIDKSLTDPFKDRKRDSFLFGEKLGDLVKDSRGIKKTGQLIQSTSSVTNLNLNPRRPSSRTRQLRGGQSYTYRTGGPRATTSTSAYHPYQYPTSYPSRRRAAPPPPATRRQPAPPLPPPLPARRSQAPAQRIPSSR